MVIDVGERHLELARTDKPLWPSGMTKGQMIDYYLAVAPALLPHLAGRPVMLARFPDGVAAGGFFEMSCRGAPDWLPLAPIPTRKGGVLRYCLLEEPAALAWVANRAAIELHPLATARELVLDLDPGPPAGLLDAARAALLLRAAADLTFLPKTSGRKGLHLHARLDGSATFAAIKARARALAHDVAARHPDLAVASVDRAARAGRVYVDWGQNEASRSLIAPYSLRAGAVPRAATPVRWDEIEAAVARGDPRLLVFGPDEARARLARHGDLLADLL